MIRSLVTAAITSPTLGGMQRWRYRAARRLQRRPRQAMFFFQVDDPYGPLALTLLSRLADRHGLAVEPWLVPAPEAAAAPEAERLADYARRDAARLGTSLRLGQPIVGGKPDPDQVALAQRIAAAALATAKPLGALIEIALALQSSDPDAELATLATAIGEAPAEAALSQGAEQRARRGHYLGSTTWFEGEFYWGVDRLHYLEARLAAEDQSVADLAPVLDPVLDAPRVPAATRPRLDFYLSFRSPYTLVAAERIGALAAAYGADLRLRFVLPMVMRGLPVPRAKQLYIARDTKREATRHGIAFGRIHDPVGIGVERGLAVLHHAITLGRGLDFAIAFLRGAFAQGIDMTKDHGLFTVAEHAGIGSEQVRAALDDQSWRAVAEANREALFALGLWGVPSFQVNDLPGWWGQDRLWMIEDDLRAELGLTPIDRRLR